MGLFDIFKTRFEYQEDEFSPMMQHESLKREFHRLRYLVRSAQETGVPLKLRIPLEPQARTALYRQIKTFQLLLEGERAEKMQDYQQTAHPMHLEIITELNDLEQWFAVTLQRFTGSDPTDQYEDEERNIVIELPAFEGSCRIAIRENAVTGITVVARPGSYTLILEDSLSGTSRTHHFSIRAGRELFTLSFDAERIPPIKAGTATLTDRVNTEVIPLD